MNELEEDIADARNELRDYIADISNENATIVQGTFDNFNNDASQFIPQSQFSPAQSSPAQSSGFINPVNNHVECSHLIPSVNNSNTSKQWIDCNIIEEVKDQLNSYTNRLNNSIIKPIYEIPDSSINQTINFNILNAELKNLNSTLFEEFQQNPSFYRSYTEIGEFNAQISENVKNFWNKYEEAINTQISSIENSIAPLDEKQKALLIKSSQLDSKQ